MFRFIFKLLLLSVLAGKATAGQVPNVALEFFKSFAESQTEEKKLPADFVQSTQYSQWFFQGFTHPAGGIFTKSALMQDAYTKGQVYWRDHPSQPRRESWGPSSSVNSSAELKAGHFEIELQSGDTLRIEAANWTYRPEVI